MSLCVTPTWRIRHCPGQGAGRECLACPSRHHGTGAVAACRAMWRHKIATVVTAAGLALAVAATVIGAPGHPHGAAPRVPGFTLPALGHPGEHVSLAAYAGRPVVVNFFASWCVPCKK